jgi:uncharacterized protein YndB with AHSA1/START domain
MNEQLFVDPNLDLTFTRKVNVDHRSIWRAWTETALLKQWFCPLPWKTVHSEINLQPGGLFQTTMQSPEGHQINNIGCFLEIIPFEKLVWTNAFLPGYRPRFQDSSTPEAKNDFIFAAIIELKDLEDGTQYTATIRHADEISCQKHDGMGFEAGWGMALDQMIHMIQKGI